MNFKELRELVAAINQTDIDELTLKNNEYELTLRKASALQSNVILSPPPASRAPVVAPPPTVPEANSVAPAPAASAEPAPAPAPTVDPTLLEITSQMVGTIYR